MSRIHLTIGKFVALFLTLTSGSAGAAIESGLSTGNDLTLIRLEGDVQVHCFDPNKGQGFRIWHCAGAVLDPSEYARFVTVPGGAASSVKLTCGREDGSVQVKKAGFNPVVGRSEPINLWIRTLFQRPLLRMGRNTVDFELLRKDGSVERSGDFVATVSEGASRSCSRKIYHSSDMNDCMNAFSICDRYFAANNWCE